MKGFLRSWLAGWLGCHQLAPSKPLSELTPQEAARAADLREPVLQLPLRQHGKRPEWSRARGSFRKPYLPSGAAANDARVTAVILRGRNMMPALGNTLSDQQLQDLMAYLHTL